MIVEAENQCEDLKKPALPTVSVGKYAYAPTTPSLPSSSSVSPKSLPPFLTLSHSIGIFRLFPNIALISAFSSMISWRGQDFFSTNFS